MEDDLPAFAALEVLAEAATGQSVSIEIEADDVTVRLGADTSATRIAEIAAALRLAR
jgi:hypothetical protein